MFQLSGGRWGWRRLKNIYVRLREEEEIVGELKDDDEEERTDRQNQLKCCQRGEHYIIESGGGNSLMRGLRRARGEGDGDRPTE